MTAALIMLPILVAAVIDTALAILKRAATGYPLPCPAVGGRQGDSEHGSRAVGLG